MNREQFDPEYLTQNYYKTYYAKSKIWQNEAERIRRPAGYSPVEFIPTGALVTRGILQQCTAPHPDTLFLPPNYKIRMLKYNKTNPFVPEGPWSN